MRITDSQTTAKNAAQIAAQRSRISLFQERLTTGKRINRPSDDPTGAEAVFNLKTSQTEIEQFRRNADFANQKLTATDDALTAYEPLLDRINTLLSQGLTDSTTQEAKNALATEVDALRQRILNVANTKYGNEFLFGGIRQNEPPFDPTTSVPSTNPTSPQYVQVEPGANALPVSTTADKIFSDATNTIFNDLTAAASALRGTGNATADRTTLLNTRSRISVYQNQVSVAHAQNGAVQNIVQIVSDRLSSDSLSYQTRAESIEGADFAESATRYTEAQRALEATLQVTARGQRSLIDFLS